MITTKEELEIFSKLQELDKLMLSLLHRLKEMDSDFNFHYSFEIYKLKRKGRKK